MTKDEVARVLDAMSATYQLMAKLLYGCGLRLMECVRLRVKDIDLERDQLIVRDGKGMKDRATMLPESVKPLLREHLARVKITHEQDLQNALEGVYLPYALTRKYPNAGDSGVGSMFFPPAASPKTRGPAKGGGITFTKADSSGQSRKPHGQLASQNPSAPIPSATASPRICSKVVMTFARYRSFSDTRMCRPR